MSTGQSRYSNNLRACIKQSGYTVQEIAKESNIPLRTLFDYCRGKTPLPRKRLDVLVRLLGYPIESIMPVMDTPGTLSLIESENAQEAVSTLLEAHKIDQLRRELLQQTAGFVSVAVMSLSHLSPNEDLLDRLSKALKRPSSIDETTLNYLEARTAGYWQDRHGALVASHDLLSYVIEHLQKVITLLEGSLLPSIRLHLCCIASEVAQLAGHILFDMNEFAYARNFHRAAITAALEGKSRALEAVAWGRMSFTWTYSGNPLEALRYIQEARRLAVADGNTTVRAYLAAVEAEIQAILGDSEACLKALEIAECVEDRQYSKEEMCWLQFDRSRLVGYQGTSFRRLYRHEDVRTRHFLEKAQKALTDALILLDHTRAQRRPALLIDLASTYAQQKDVEAACGYGIQALSIIARTKSHAVARRLLALRQELEPWKDSPCVNNLDQQIVSLITSGGYRGVV
jgi:transcriptional regulator with XRE-family HTH domain/DNA-binding transcriptional MerR regulator